jgi:uncharacterized protein YifN (PemK superfamily)
MCDFGPNPENIADPGVLVGPLAVKPEIWKLRPAVVLSARFGLTTLVPVSTEPPRTVTRSHYHIPDGKYAFLAADEENWVKAELIETASNQRLDRPFLAGRRSIVHLDAEDLKAVRQAVLHALALGSLTEHL